MADHHLKALMLTHLELTPGICRAIEAIGQAILMYRPGEMSAALLEIPKIALADAVLAAIREQLKAFPKLLGEAGQSGYLVVSLARQTAVVPTFQTLLPSQREALARDWIAGKKALQEHQVFLRQESKALRRKTLIGRGIRAARSFLNDNPAGWLVLLGLLALAIAIVSRQLID